MFRRTAPETISQARFNQDKTPASNPPACYEPRATDGPHVPIGSRPLSGGYTWRGLAHPWSSVRTSRKLQGSQSSDSQARLTTRIGAELERSWLGSSDAVAGQLVVPSRGIIP